MSKQQFTPLERQALWETYDRRCWYCNEHLPCSNMQIDHVVPEHLVRDSALRLTTLQAYGLSPSFDITSFSNLVPACGRCNGLKRGTLYPPGQAVILLGRLDAGKVERAHNRLLKQSKSDRLLASVASALSIGAISRVQVAPLVASGGETQSFPLTRALPGLATLRSVFPAEYESYLDCEPELPDTCPGGLPFDDGRRLIRTFRDYREALKAGADHGCCMYARYAYAVFGMPLALLELMKGAQFARKSYVDEPRRGVCDLELIPCMVLDSRHEDHHKSVADLVRMGSARVTDVTSHTLLIDEEHDWTYLFELCRADTDADGCQDIVVWASGGAQYGNRSTAALFTLRRTSDDSMFEAQQHYYEGT